MLLQYEAVGPVVIGLHLHQSDSGGFSLSMNFVVACVVVPNLAFAAAATTTGIRT